ncbi:helix-turn-helix transcriptional regulator [Tranquillimonas rosea]|uniref:helix-turn-helix transcriptional regulator n=1 Tax=Tranquillimonas rosea TaxID=641238 RepID=UPI003BA94FC6
MTQPTTAPDSTAGYQVAPIQRAPTAAQWRTAAMRSYGRGVLYWFTRGQGRITMQVVTRGYGANNAIFLPPRTMHGFEMMGQVNGTAVFLPDEPDLLWPETILHLRVRDVQHQAELTAMVDNLRREISRDDPARARALRYHAGLLSVWLERQAATSGQEEVEPRRAADRLAAAFTALVERDFRSGAGVAHYAARLGVTPTHLSRACRAASGRPASALLQDRVHYEARWLLAETRSPVKKVAEQLGFRSAAYFTRAFHAHTGQTPSEFRKHG